MSLRKKISRRVSLERRSRAAWYAWSRIINLISSPKDDAFQKTGVKIGRIPSPLVVELKSKLTKHRPFSAKDCLPNYLVSSGLEDLEDSINQSLRYLALDAAELQALGKACATMREQISSCLGVGWRIVNAKAWVSTPNSMPFGPNDWHVDGFPLGVYKALLYVTAPGPKTGSTEVITKTGETILVEGPAGTYSFFDTSRLLHRGVAPSDGERIAIELTIVPAIKNDQTPVFAGSNARHPIYPWS